MFKRRATRSPLLAELRQLFAISRAARSRSGPPADELLDMRRQAPRPTLSRRALLQGGAALGATTLISRAGLPLFAQERAPRVAIVGAGIAGVNAAYQLQKAGVIADVYDAADRIGGRMFSIDGAVNPGITIEMGGEFINGDHDDLLALVEELGLELIDRATPEEAALTGTDYFFGGRRLTPAELLEAFAPFAEAIEADATRLDDEYDEVYPEYDALSISEYLDRLGITGLLRDVIEVGFVAENGSPAAAQSAINFLYLAPAAEEGGFEVVGGSDERYKVRGGNQQVPAGLAARLERGVQLGHALEAVRRTSDGVVQLYFQAGGISRLVEADYVIFAMPFTTLRNVDLGLPLPPMLRTAIDTLGYGTSSKLMVGTTSRPWRAQGHSGYSISDSAYMLSWDTTQGVPGDAAALTFFAGGVEALAYADGTPEAAAARLLAGLEPVYPGVSAAFNGQAARQVWPLQPWTLAGYSSPRPGQTAFFDVMAEPFENLLFAGEHTSADYWGYMNGGAESGRRAAEQLLELLGV